MRRTVVGMVGMVGAARHRTRVGCLLTVVALAGCTTHGAATAGAKPTAPAPPPVTASAPAPAASPDPVPGQALAADVVAAEVTLRATPDGAPVVTLANPTAEQMPLVLLVTDRSGDWLQVQAALRPNGARRWVQAADVVVRSTPYRILVELGEHRLTVRRGTEPVLEAPVAIGTPDNPTPTGSFYIDAAVSTNPDGPYGARELSVAGFSQTITSGAGGGQIAIHGTNAPSLIGQSASHGCVRMLNADVIKLFNLVPVGTPVDIVV